MTEYVDNMQTRRAELAVLRTLPELLTNHLEHRAGIPVYMYYDNRTKEWVTLTAAQTYERVQRWARAFAALGLKRGERVAMLLPNGIDAICFDMAALTCALVPVPLHAIDTAGSSAFILRDSGARFLVTTKLSRYKDIAAAMDLPDLNTVVITDALAYCDEHRPLACHGRRRNASRRARAHGPGGHRLYVGHDRQTQGRDAHAPRDPLEHQRRSGQRLPEHGRRVALVPAPLPHLRAPCDLLPGSRVRQSCGL